MTETELMERFAHEMALKDGEIAGLRDALAAEAQVAALTEKLKMAQDVSERVAQLTAHRACCGNEHDGMSKFHGYCVVCGVPWPCEYAGQPPKFSPVAAQGKPCGFCAGNVKVPCPYCSPAPPSPEVKP